MRPKLTLCLAACLLLLGLAGTAQAAPTVSNVNDSGPGSLRQAIAEAAPGETITVPAGDYHLSSEPLLIEKSLTLAGHALHDTFLRSVGPFRVITTKGAAAAKIDVTLSNLTARDGRVFEAVALGGGISATDTNLTLRGVEVTGNLANANGEMPAEKGGTAAGGGVLLASGSLTVIESRVTGNTAEAVGGPGGAGGLVPGGGVAVLQGSMNIEKSTISGNVTKANGGQGPSNPEQSGGVSAGAGLGGSFETGTASIVSSTFSGNISEATPGPGGAAGEVGGGGLYLTATQPVVMSNLTVTGNAISNGSGGTSPAAGGGILGIAQAGGSFAVTSSSIVANRIESGTPNSQAGNVFAVGAANTFTFKNSIVANGVAPAGSENCGIGTGTNAFASQGFNLDSANQCGFTAAGDKVNTNPLLSPLAASVAGQPETLAPATGSPVIDQGAAFVLTTDERGVKRPIDLPAIPNATAPGADGSDIGAYEVQPLNALKLGKLKKDKKKGTATLTVTVPAPAAGVLKLSGKGLKTQKAAIKTKTTLKLKVIAKGGAKKALAKNGKRKVKISVSYTPTGNTATTKKRSVKLIKTLKKPKQKRAGGGNR